MIGRCMGHKNIRRITKSGGQIKDNEWAINNRDSILKQIDEHREQSCKLQIIVVDV